MKMDASNLNQQAGSSLKTEHFSGSREHLLAELARIDLLIRLQVFRARQVTPEGKFRGLTISDEDVDAALDAPVGRPSWADVPLPPGLAAVPAQLERMQQDIALKVAGSARQGIRLRLVHLAQVFSLSAFDVDVLLIALLPELELRYERIYAYLHDDVTRKLPSVDLALGLLCPSLVPRLAARARFAAEAPLLRHGLIQLVTDPAQPHAPLLAHAIKLDARIVSYLHDGDELPSELASWVRREHSTTAAAGLRLPAALQTDFEGLLKALRTDSTPLPIVYLRGGRGAGRQTLAGALAHSVGRELLVLRGTLLDGMSPDVLLSRLKLLLRETQLSPSLLYWDGFDALWTGDRQGVAAAVLRLIEESPCVSFLAGQTPWGHSLQPHPARLIVLDVPVPEPPQRTALWTEALADALPMADDVDLSGLAQQFQLQPGQIIAAAHTAIAHARKRDPLAPRIARADLWAACREHSAPQLGPTARKLTSPFSWGDLILAQDRMQRIKELCLHARYRHQVLREWGFERKLATGQGLSALFTGPPGTGKTMAAGIVARELGLDLYQIDLSSVVSKYIGETEKNLARIFDEAESGHVVLFFDEADALFGKRSEVQDAHDRHANIETSYLLQRMESYQGVVILASNFPRNLDEAFLRRIRFIIEFTLPDERERRRIWEQIWPPDVPRERNLDVDALAKKVDLAGGYIRNIALSAAFLAAAEGKPVSRRHLIHATRREYQKLGKTIDEKMLGGI